ncbi:flagellar export chaperone FliS [Novosphingobium bradum]|uniref:Flagellar export chaperone FliS n=1 Tax=Novosphingobium bradum TaxID=1737444 RepID=A0ABV7IXA3_9SPHN
MTMLARRTPDSVYRRVDFDARVNGADPMELVGLCYEHLVAALGSALFAHERRDNAAKSEALTRALSALTALQLGVKGTEGVAAALLQFYQAAKNALLDSVLSFDPDRIGKVRGDVLEIASALHSARTA